MNGFEVYKYYLGIKTHFSSKDYDVVAAGGRVKAGQTAYLKRRDRIFFEGLAKKYDQPREVIKYLVANFAYGHTNVLYDREVGQELLQKWIKNKESLSKVFSDDLKKIAENCSDYYNDFHNAITINDTLLKMYKSDLINIETLCLIVQFNPDLLSNWNTSPMNELLYNNLILRITKLRSFVRPTENCERVWKQFTAK